LREVEENRRKGNVHIDFDGLEELFIQPFVVFVLVAVVVVVVVVVIVAVVIADRGCCDSGGFNVHFPFRKYQRIQ
jgi:hypothetical protein